MYTGMFSYRIVFSHFQINIFPDNTNHELGLFIAFSLKFNLIRLLF